MKKLRITCIFLLLILAFFIIKSNTTVCNHEDICTNSNKKNSLWNGKDLTGWTFVSDTAIDEHTIWTVKDGILHCSGSITGYLKTNKTYSNYKLNLEWRWPEKEGNSGVLIHTKEPDKVWPKCVECQLFSSKAGDLILIDVPTITVDGEKLMSKKRFYKVEKKKESSEKPIGEWNTYTIICKDNAIECYVNNMLQNNGTDLPISSGAIAIQSEGTPIEFRNIYVEF